MLSSTAWRLFFNFSVFYERNNASRRAAGFLDMSRFCYQSHHRAPMIRNTYHCELEASDHTPGRRLIWRSSISTVGVFFSGKKEKKKKKGIHLVCFRPSRAPTAPAYLGGQVSALIPMSGISKVAIKDGHEGNGPNIDLNALAADCVAWLGAYATGRYFDTLSPLALPPLLVRSFWYRVEKHKNEKMKKQKGNYGFVENCELVYELQRYVSTGFSIVTPRSTLTTLLTSRTMVGRW